MRSALKISVGGLVAALGLVLMLMTALPFGTYAFPAFAGMLLVVIVIEFGFVHAFAVFAATALLSFLIVTDKEAALLYTIFFGYYPIVKSLIERIPNRPVQYVIKYIVFNVSMIASFFIAIWVLSVPQESFVIFGVYLPWVFLIAGNIVFLLYDICITRVVTLYLLKWHDKLNHK